MHYLVSARNILGKDGLVHGAFRDGENGALRGHVYVPCVRRFFAVPYGDISYTWRDVTCVQCLAYGTSPAAP